MRFDVKRLPAALLILVLLAGSAGAQYFGKNKVHYESFDWRVYHSPHFDLYYYPEEEALATQAVLLVEEAYERLSLLLDHRPSARVPLVLYSAHPFFQQTNVTPSLISEATGGFTDIYRSRVVLPYNGSVPDFRHVVAHELVHVFMLDILYGGIGPEHAMRSLGQMQMPPLWFIEGMAEYLSTGWDSEAEQFLQDSVAGDYLYDLDSYFGGFMVYKEGQAVIRYLVENYGEGVLAELVRGTRRERTFEKSLEKRLGMDLKELSRQFRRDARAVAWKNMEGREDPAQIAFPLREHEKESKVFFRNPVLSPRGDRVAYFSDHKGEVNLYLAGVTDGKEVKKLVTGHRSMGLESLHPFDTGACFDPTGERLVFVALKGGRDELVIVDAENGEELERFRPPLDSMRHPAWSPDGTRIVVSGVSGGVTDLWLLDLTGGLWSPLTDDLADEQDPAWLDAGSLVYARHPALFPKLFEDGVPAPGDLSLDTFGGHGEVFEPGRGYDLWILRLDGPAEPLVSTAGHDRSPLPRPDGGLYFTSDAAGLEDLWIWRKGLLPERVLAPAGGVLDPNLSADGERLVFSTLRQGGYDIFLHEAVAELSGESASGDPERWTHRPFDQTLPSVLALADETEAEEPDSLAGINEDYKVRFLVDAVGRQLTYHNLYGFYGSSVIQLKDVLGDHEMLIMLDIFGRISDSNFLFGYTNRQQRFNWSVGAYSFLNFYQSTVSGLEETLPEDRLFYEWSRGVWAGGIYPFSLFTRLEADLNFYYTRREYFTEVDLFGDPVEGGVRDPENRLLLQPGISLVHDNALFDYLGPVKGSRWIASLSYATDVAGDIDVNRWVGVADYRKYLLGPAGHSLALRLSARRSDGLSGEGKGDPLFFHLGGPMSLRGYDYLEFAGTRTVLGSLEWRFPFIRGVWFGGPIPLAFGNIGGAFFADFGGAWNEGDRFQAASSDGGYHLRDLRGDIGYGLRFNLGGWLLLWDFAWPTNLQEMGDRRVHFSIGAQF